MRACSDGCSVVPVIVVEVHVVELEVLRTSSNNTVRRCNVKIMFGVRSSSNDSGTIDIAFTLFSIPGHFKFNTGENTVSDFKVSKLNISDIKGNSSVSLTFISCEI
jgi:hypothetical protein